MIALALVSAALAAASPEEVPVGHDSFYRLSTKTLEGAPADLSAYAGKVALVVNVASECGYTPQYEGLEKLYGELKDRGFVVLAFPCNDFGSQEPGSPGQIRAFCHEKYGVTFPLFDKLVTKDGDGQSPIYAELKRQTGELPSWNFGKYLVAKDGRVLGFYKHKVKPDDADLRAAIESALQ